MVFDHKAQTQVIGGHMRQAIDDADVALRRLLVMMATLGYTEADMSPVLLAMDRLTLVSRTHEAKHDIVQAIYGVLP